MEEEIRVRHARKPIRSFSIQLTLLISESG
jgi:hypothetical protein